MSEVAGVLSVLLVRVEHEAVRADSPPTVSVLTCPVFVALVRVGKVEVFLRQLGVGRTSATETHFSGIPKRDAERRENKCSHVFAITGKSCSSATEKCIYVSVLN